MILPISSSGVNLEQSYALQDIQQIVNEYGGTVNFYKIAAESNLSRDRYNSIKERDVDSAPLKLSLKSFPILFNPSKKELEKVGVKEEVDLIFYTAKQDWTDNSLAFDDIDLIRWRITLQDKEYELLDKKQYGQYGDTFLYYVFTAKIV